jgi:copper chaperone NosL
MKKNYSHLFLTPALSLLLFISPGANAAEKAKPTVCKQCNMNIEEANRKSAVYVMQGIEASGFDDIGCAVAWRNGECAMRQSAFDENAVAHDYLSEETVPVEKAFYVVSSDIKTPMGYGIAAFKNKEQAVKFASGHGNSKVVTLNELISLKLK